MSRRSPESEQGKDSGLRCVCRSSHQGTPSTAGRGRGRSDPALPTSSVPDCCVGQNLDTPLWTGVGWPDPRQREPPRQRTRGFGGRRRRDTNSTSATTLFKRSGCIISGSVVSSTTSRERHTMEDKKYRTIEVKPDWCVMCELLQMEQEYDRGEEPRSLTIDPLDFLPENLCAWHRAEAMRDAR